MDRKISLGLAFAIGMTMVASAQAQNTYLINFPVADVLKHREVEFTFRAGGFARNVSKGFTYEAAATVGILDRGQVGISNDLKGHTTYNGAFNVYNSEEGKYSVTIGANRYDPDANLTDSYVAFRKDFPTFKFYASAYKMDKIVGIFGVDFNMAHGFTGAIEHRTGSESEIWVAAKTPVFYKGFSAMLASRFPWDGGPNIQYQAVLNYSLRF